MDLNDIWQEHKVWILGLLGAIVAFLIVNGLISGHYDTKSLERTIGVSRSKLRQKEWYKAAERRVAMQDKTRLDEELARVEARTYFRIRPKFDLKGKGNATLHYLQTTTEVKGRVQEAMDAASVDFTQQQLGLPANSPVDRQETQKTLVALDLIDDALSRLLEASDQVQLGNPDAQGLRALDQIQIDTGSKTVRGPRRFGGRRQRKEVDLGERVAVKVRFHTDAVTLRSFLESLVTADRRPLLLENLAAKSPDKPGEPMAVTCRFLALLPKKEV